MCDKYFHTQKLYVGSTGTSFVKALSAYHCVCRPTEILSYCPKLDRLQNLNSIQILEPLVVFELFYIYPPIILLAFYNSLKRLLLNSFLIPFFQIYFLFFPWTIMFLLTSFCNMSSVIHICLNCFFTILKCRFIV